MAYGLPREGRIETSAAGDNWITLSTPFERFSRMLTKLTYSSLLVFYLMYTHVGEGTGGPGVQERLTSGVVCHLRIFARRY